VRSASPERAVIGIDDTDMPGTPGTGRLARMLATRLESAGFGNSSGVTRHQLFEGPGVPKTSHNSSAAIVLENEDGVGAGEFGVAFLRAHAARGSDPGIAIVSGSIEPAGIAFARRVQQSLVSQAEAKAMARTLGVELVGVAGTRDGVIGALAAAMLRADGNDGRFVGLPGIRDLRGRMKVGDILAGSGVAAVVDAESGRPLSDDQMLDTRDWVRPRVIDHRPVVVAKRREAGWEHADTRTT
jgi:hypothetical protein